MSDICLLTNLPAPYRLPIFEEINTHHNLTVKFLQESDSSRHWSTKFEDYTFDFEFLNVNHFPTLQINNRVRSIFKETMYDVCIVGESPMHTPTLLYVMCTAKMKDIPLVIWTEGVDVERGNPKSVRDLITNSGRKLYDSTIRRWTYSLADFFIAYSDIMTEDFLERRGVDRGQIFSGIQTMPQSLIGSNDGQQDELNEFTILYLGYLVQRKGVDVLIDAYRELQHPDTELIIAGDGPDSERLRSLASDLENVRFTGFVPRESKWELYRRADLFVLPTFLDTWGLVVNEALFFDTPVITTEAAGASQLVHKYDLGKVVPPHDADRLRDAIVEIVESPELQSVYQNNAIACDVAWDPVVGAQPFLSAIDRATEPD